MLASGVWVDWRLASAFLPRRGHLASRHFHYFEAPGLRSLIRYMDSVLRVPELARWIYGCSDRKDFIHLALTCRSVFPLAIPFTWENVKGVSRLFVLLREDAISEYEEAEGEPIITELVSHMGAS